MKNMNRILVYVDTDRTTHSALQRASELMRRHGAKATFVDVVRELPSIMQFFSPDIDDIESIVVEDRRMRLEAAVQASGVDTASATIEILRGPPAASLAEYSKLKQFDLIIKTAYGGGDHAPSRMTDIAKRLIRNAETPVWIQQRHREENNLDIAAAIDPMGAEEIALSVLSHAADFARERNTQLRIIVVFDMFGAELIRKRDPEQADHYVKESRSRQMERVASLLDLEDLKDVHIVPHFLDGETTDAISNHLAEQPVGLLVSGTVARTGLGGLIIGNTSEGLVQIANTSHFIVRPANSN